MEGGDGEEEAAPEGEAANNEEVTNNNFPSIIKISALKNEGNTQWCP